METVQLHSRMPYDFSWQGETCYLALHDIVLADGEVAIENGESSSLNNLRDRLTFVPPNMRVEGWSELAGPNNSYTALFFDPDLAETELERPLLGVVERPLLYFQDAQLADTLRRIAALGPNNDARLKAEALGLLAVLQLYPSLGMAAEPRAGQLGVIERKRIRDYVEASLGAGISLTDLAKVAGLSRYHFARSFTRTWGRSPHQYVLMRQIATAASLLAKSNMPIADIATHVGFSSPARLSTAFRRQTGQSPRMFRQALR